jgi:catechol 2,3-dioxygenase-like lactoylglutathione lyase family enzyme
MQPSGTASIPYCNEEPFPWQFDCDFSSIDVPRDNGISVVMAVELDPLKNLRGECEAPGHDGVLETTLYVDDLEKAEQFYGGILGLAKIYSVPGRQLVFRCGDGVLLIFDPKQTERDPIMINGAKIPLHGARGAGHMAFRVPHERLAAWRDHLGANHVSIESEIAWPNAAHSIYFRDPAGNSLEFATTDIWKVS